MHVQHMTRAISHMSCQVLDLPLTVLVLYPLQEQLRKSLLARIADKLEEGGQHPSPSRLVSALSPSRSKAQFEDTIPGAAWHLTLLI